MISRYSTHEMNDLWSDDHRMKMWLKVEAAVLRELVHLKKIPLKEGKRLLKKLEPLCKSGISYRDVEREEKVLKHDVIAFTTVVSKKLGSESRYFHYGLTSSDVVDTSCSMQIRDSGKIVIQEIQRLKKILKKLALKHKNTPCIGRSHGIFAEPTSFGLKFLGFYQDISRALSRIEHALEDIRVGKISGAVGVCPHWSTQSEKRVLSRLGLKAECVSTQVLSRDLHAALSTAFASYGSCLEKIAVEMRHLQRSEVSEMQEGFHKGQKGSSAMPHKRNPISSENLTGVARLLRSYAIASLENVALWHERDISHSSVERIVLPDTFHLVHYATKRISQTLENATVQKDQIKQNLEKAGDISFSGHVLLALVEKGAKREEAYYWVQECAHLAVDQKKSFFFFASTHKKIRGYLTESEIKNKTSISYQLRHVDQIFKRTFQIYS